MTRGLNFSERGRVSEENKGPEKYWVQVTMELNLPGDISTDPYVVQLLFTGMRIL